MSRPCLVHSHACCPVTRGRDMYESWLWFQYVPPDDLWDYLDETDQAAWEGLAIRVNWPSK